VRHEFLAWDENKNREAALTVLISGSFFVPCDTYDSAEVTLYLLEKLHQAEAEALSQTKHQNAEYLLIDEKQGRRIAEQERRKVRGTARILADLYLLGVVDLWDNIRRLREETTFRITDKIIQQAILDAKAERELLL
jgi:predicted nucleic acid-binding protein